jgi:hypothetical protein
VSIVNFQMFRLTGSRCYLQRDPVASVEQPIIDLGRVEPISPAITPQVVTLDDSDGGVKFRIDEDLVGIEETYEVRFSNLNMDNQALLFAASPPTTFSQAATPVVGLNHWAVPGKMVKIRNAAGALVYGLTSVDTVGGLATPADWQVVSLERGLIRLVDPAAGGSFAAAGNLAISYTPRSISGLRLLNPQSVTGSVKGTALFVWGSKNNTEQVVREARVSLVPTGASFTVDAYSSGTVRMTVLGDLRQPVPAGRLLYWLGSLPATS